uniref:Uncharacterized protein n=1 Tax=Anguilla anguilla TaxID=7936 RepID=A0A0E9S0M4_ANGAN
MYWLPCNYVLTIAMACDPGCLASEVFPAKA